MKKQALISVSDKTGVVDFARELVALGYHILSTGGTAKLLTKEGVPCQEVADYTGFPEMLDGRVKTLNPKIHAGILARRPVAEHMAALEAHGIDPIDIICVNLYPFEQTIAKPDCTFEDAIENIDIGGPTMIRDRLRLRRRRNQGRRRCHGRDAPRARQEGLRPYRPLRRHDHELPHEP